MQIKPDRLADQLSAGNLLPVYLVTGDEPLQAQEAADAIRKAARAAGFSDRQVFEAQKGFSWDSLAAEADALSLFADRRLFDLRIPGGKPGKEGGAALTAYAANPPPDTLLLVSLPKLDRSQRNTKWFKSLEGIGAVVSIWPVEPRALPTWLRQRARKHGLDLEADALSFLAGQTEGNLLAAAQEIEKLTLLHEGGRIDLESVAASVAGSARYNVFELVDSALGGNAARTLGILAGLRSEGTPPLVVLWSLTRELRVLEAVARALESGLDSGRVLAAHRVWDRRKSLVGQGARRQSAAGWQRLLRTCARTDRASKGRDVADPWQLLEDVVAGMSLGDSWRAPGSAQSL